MASGIEMMMKALGLDPEQIRAQMERPIAEIVGGIRNLGERLAAIDERLSRIEQHLKIQEASNTVLLEDKRRSA